MNKIMRCEGCERCFSILWYGPDKHEGLKLEPVICQGFSDAEPGLCPRCALAWFRSLSRGNDPVMVARTKARK